MQLSYLRVLILGLGLISTTPTTPVSLSQVVTINNCIHGVGAVGAGLFSCMQVYSGIKCRCAHRGARLMHIAAFSVSALYCKLCIEKLKLKSASQQQAH